MPLVTFCFLNWNWWVLVNQPHSVPSLGRQSWLSDIEASLTWCGFQMCSPFSFPSASPILCLFTQSQLVLLCQIFLHFIQCCYLRGEEWCGAQALLSADSLCEYLPLPSLCWILAGDQKFNAGFLMSDRDPFTSAITTASQDLHEQRDGVRNCSWKTGASAWDSGISKHLD